MKLRNERSSSQGEPLGFGAQASSPKKPVDAVAAPVQRAVGREAAQRLRDHRALHRVEGGLGARCPGAAAVFAVTTSSGLPRSQARLSMSPKMWQLEHDASPLPEVEHGVVEERPARRRSTPARDCAARGSASVARVAGSITAHRVVEAREHVEAVVGLVEHEAARAAAGRDVVRARRRRVVVGLEGRVLERRRAEHADLRRAERGHVDGSRGRHDHLERRREAVVLLVDAAAGSDP